MFGTMAHFSNLRESSLRVQRGYRRACTGARKKAETILMTQHSRQTTPTQFAPPVGGASARGVRFLHGRPDEPDLGDRCLCEHLQARQTETYTALYQCTDAALLARAVEWMATDPKCANQTLNITNGDLIRWQNVWPKFANFFGMELAPPRHINLTRSDRGAKR
jgi:hypothetical protein